MVLIVVVVIVMVVVMLCCRGVVCVCVCVCGEFDFRGGVVLVWCGKDGPMVVMHMWIQIYSVTSCQHTHTHTHTHIPSFNLPHPPSLPPSLLADGMVLWWCRVVMVMVMVIVVVVK